MNKPVHLVGIIHKDIDGYDRLTMVLDRISPDIIALELDEKREASFEIDHVYNIRALTEQKKAEAPDLEAKLTADSDIFNELNSNSIEYLKRTLTVNQMVTLLLGEEIFNGMVGFEYAASKSYVLRNNHVQLKLIDPINIELSQLAQAFCQLQEEALIDISQASTGPDECFFDFLNAGIDGYLQFKRNLISQSYDDKSKQISLFEDLVANHSSSQDNAYIRTVFDPKRNDLMISNLLSIIQDNKEASVTAIVGLGHLEYVRIGLSGYDVGALSLSSWMKELGLTL